MIVNGELISTAAIHRELAYRLGKREIETRKLEIIIQREMENQGLTLADFDLDAEVEKMIASTREKMKAEYGDRLTEEEILANNNIDQTSWRSQTRLMLLFSYVFLPENPEEWPPATVKALSDSGEDGEEGAESEDGNAYMESLIAAYKERKAAGLIDEASKQSRLQYNMLLRGPILQSIEEGLDIRTAQDGIPAELVMTVEGAEIRTEDIFNQIKGRLAPIEWRRTRLWLAKVTAMRQALVKLGAYMDDETFETMWEELDESHRETIFPLQAVVLGFKRFPSMSAYRNYYRGIESYRTLIKDEFNDVNLGKHMDRVNRLLGLEEVEAEVILLSAYDFTMAEWKENGWETAKERAIKVSREIAEGGNWDEILLANSDFWDPPVPESQKGEPQRGSLRNRGKFGPKNRNSLLQMVAENDFEIFINGSSVGDAIFFDIETGKIGGPYKGPYGYYIARVKSRTPAIKSYDLADATHRPSIEMDYLQVRFNQFAAQAMAEAEVEGL